MIAALLLATLSPAPVVSCRTLCDAERLRPWFDKLARTRRDRHAVRILQIGDSHTAGDQITGAWRAVLQARFGNAGRGLLPPGRPYQGYLTRDVTATQSAGWSVAGIFGAAYKGAGGPLIGVSGYSLTSTVEGASMAITADRVSFDRLTVCALAGPGAGTMRLQVGGVVRAVPLASERVEPRCETMDSDGPAYGASLTVEGGAVTVTSWSTERRDTGGVILSNLGTVGAQLTHVERTDDRVVAAEIATYRPDLLVVAFGTNEAFLPRFSGVEYERRLRADIARLKRLAPGVPVLLIGAPDSATRQPALQSGESGMSAPCPASDDFFAPERLDGNVIAPPPLPAPGLQSWRPTAALASVQTIERRVAHDLGLAFWDWGAAMGGRCTATAWATQVPPLMRGDRVHFTTVGGAEIARRLQADLDAAATVPGANPVADLVGGR